MADTNNVKKARPTEEKRMDTNRKANANNVAKRTRIKSAIKEFKVAVEAKDVVSAQVKLNSCISLINRAKSDGIYHKNTAARKISTLTKMYNAIA